MGKVNVIYDDLYTTSNNLNEVVSYLENCNNHIKVISDEINDLTSKHGDCFSNSLEKISDLEQDISNYLTVVNLLKDRCSAAAKAFEDAEGSSIKETDEMKAVLDDCCTMLGISSLTNPEISVFKTAEDYEKSVDSNTGGEESKTWRNTFTDTNNDGYLEVSADLTKKGESTVSSTGTGSTSSSSSTSTGTGSTSSSSTTSTSTSTPSSTTNTTQSTGTTTQQTTTTQEQTTNSGQQTNNTQQTDTAQQSNGMIQQQPYSTQTDAGTNNLANNQTTTPNYQTTTPNYQDNSYNSSTNNNKQNESYTNSRVNMPTTDLSDESKNDGLKEIALGTVLGATPAILDKDDKTTDVTNNLSDDKESSKNSNCRDDKQLDEIDPYDKNSKSDEKDEKDEKDSTQESKKTDIEEKSLPEQTEPVQPAPVVQQPATESQQPVSYLETRPSYSGGGYTTSNVENVDTEPVPVPTVEPGPSIESANLTHPETQTQPDESIVKGKTISKIPTATTPIAPTTKKTSGNSLIPIAAGLGAAAAAGIGSKVYLDRKNNSDNGEMDEFDDINDNDYSDDNKIEIDYSDADGEEEDVIEPYEAKSNNQETLE